MVWYTSVERERKRNYKFHISLSFNRKRRKIHTGVSNCYYIGESNFSSTFINLLDKIFQSHRIRRTISRNARDGVDRVWNNSQIFVVMDIRRNRKIINPQVNSIESSLSANRFELSFQLATRIRALTGWISETACFQFTMSMIRREITWEKYTRNPGNAA